MFRVIIILSLVILGFTNETFVQLPRAQDIDGGATLIFGRPSDPKVGATSAGSATRSQRASAGEDKQGRTGSAVEDALALGNSARNANPPRYHDAELAYRLAAKLDPKDPRPVMGLANLWYDQKQFQAAAKMYREAYSLMSSAGGGSLRSQTPSAQQRLQMAQIHGNLGASLLQTKKLNQAQVELEKAIALDRGTARWHALSGYCLSKLQKPELAVNALREALRLEPGNDEYRKLLRSVEQ
jgi:Tfp pilus assembly protein PilF